MSIFFSTFLQLEANNRHETRQQILSKYYSQTYLCGHLNKAVTSALRPVGEGTELCCISYSTVISLYSGHLCITYYSHIAPPHYNQLHEMIHRV